MHTPWVSFDGKNCGGCKHLNNRGYCEFTACIIPCTVSGTIPEVKPRTNADRIRTMTDEELAEWISHPKISYCQHDICDGETDCAVCALQWLKQEV